MKTWLRLLLLALFMAELFVYTWSRVQCVNTGYQISRAAGERKDALALQKKLKVELTHLNSPARIGRIARERLGPQRDLAVISGPTFAKEVARGLPTAITVASARAEHAHRLADHACREHLAEAGEPRSGSGEGRIDADKLRGLAANLIEVDRIDRWFLCGPLDIPFIGLTVPNKQNANFGFFRVANIGIGSIYKHAFQSFRVI